MTAPGSLTSPPPRAARGASWPRRLKCVCGDEIVELLAFGDPVQVDVSEIVPLQPCPSCRGAGARGPKQARSECGRCYGTGTIGEPIATDVPLVALGPSGHARWILLADRERGEALHHPHMCRAITSAR